MGRPLAIQQCMLLVLPVLPSRDAARVAEDLRLKEGFKCPKECQECCDLSAHTFKCVLRTPFSANEPRDKKAIPDHICTNAGQRTSKTTSQQAEVTCLYNAAEKQYRKSGELTAKCSSNSRCCCDKEGVGYCIGDVFHEDRLRRLYAPAEGAEESGEKLLKRLFPLTQGREPQLHHTGICPAGFSDWRDGSSEQCQCDVACGIGSTEEKPKPRAAAWDHRWKQVAGLSDGIYYGEIVVAGWVLEKLWDMSDGHWTQGIMGKYRAVDYVGIYRKLDVDNNYKECAVAFAGTDDIFNVVADALGWMQFTKSWCGFKDVHRSMRNYMNEFFYGDRYDEFNEFLSDSKECDKVIGVGHSLGGSLASLLAGCTNQPAGKQLPGKNINFEIDEIYTFGAAGVATTMPTNPDGKNGCFQGARFYRTSIRPEKKGKPSLSWIDPVPNIGSWRPWPLLHPKTEVVDLIEQTDESGDVAIKDEATECETDEKGKPARYLQQPWGVLFWKFDMELHTMGEYYRALQEHKGLAGKHTAQGDTKIVEGAVLKNFLDDLRQHLGRES
mmetsp:Transcript_62759/g.178246  ORF Transcript_62759/g.178246 Transcript_62759/m.178246 type:complete len:553 (-) Transcript_62759:25-1683(-)